MYIYLYYYSYLYIWYSLVEFIGGNQFEILCIDLYDLYEPTDIPAVIIVSNLGWTSRQRHKAGRHGLSGIDYTRPTVSTGPPL